MDVSISDNNNSSDSIINNISKCPTHNKQFKFICYKCNELLCSKCINTHLQLKGADHYCQHIDEISSNLSSHFKEGGVVNSSDHMKKRVDNLWQNINHSSNSLSNLEQKENEITKYYAELHEYLRVEELRLKKPILADKESVAHNIKDSLVELQSYFSIYSWNNHYQNNLNKANHIIDNNNSNCFKEVEEKSLVSQINETDSSLNERQSLLEFLEENSDLFGMEGVGKVQSSRRDSKDTIDPILFQVYQYNEKYKIEEVPSPFLINQYTITRSDDLDEIFGDILEESIVMHIKTPEEASIEKRLMSQKSIDELSQSMIQQSNIGHSESERIKKTYIFSTNMDEGATLIDITDPNNINSESIEYFYSSKYTFNSVVSVGEFVYVFGGGKDIKNQSKYFRYSTKDRKPVKGDFRSEINGVAGGRSISVCFDGQNYIYLINGHDCSTNKYHRRIDRFNLKNMGFEKFYSFPENQDQRNHVFSFFYKDILYTMMDHGHKIYAFCPDTKVLSHLPNKNIDEICAACTDGAGNLYILMKNPNNVEGFCRLNIDTNNIEKLQLPKDIEFGDSMLYHEGVIYLIGGKDYKNHTYSVEKKQWSTFFENDTSIRKMCGSAIVNIN
ncbi:hypothetical protein PPL_09781 [Heterostelium album PN500]|uniref:B box-type domain-containing protein n=1 Tax=Heterostelium pallidum (strain ATCC 26659 / Pp 5 / PN500) TaxID=670386 RepID=D3BP19_HETP5|nr:hypothetical protein PPL_09781 [Heterostelium album PN500]EFA77029.1 hypothetical protein PPL_09781 [Heterostelium album PN500]|eukprot:XP_020429159.1 hypothetical protein PPL_09781 [Heterostelium album PN500]